MKKILNIILLLLLAGLIVFLPYSSWLVSYSGNIWFSLIRDCFIGFIFLFAVLSSIKPKNGAIYLALLFLVWTALSYFWREPSAVQWLKGFRFLALPIVLYVSVSQINFSEKYQKIIKIVMLAGALPILFLAGAEAFGFNLLPLAVQDRGIGVMVSTHLVGETSIQRIQSILAGPNAFALYLLVLTGLLLTLKTRWKWLFAVIPVIFIALSYSRSSMIGVAVLLILLGLDFFRRKLGGLKSLLLFSILGAALIFAGVTALKKPEIRSLITHDASTELRVVQYKRIWAQRNEIGLLGRGTGTAGPSSQYRFDGGENHWTENTYLDIFEEVGLVGVLIYLAFITASFVQLARAKNPYGRTILALGISLSVAGLFINYYTGQVAITYFWLINALGANYEKNLD